MFSKSYFMCFVVGIMYMIGVQSVNGQAFPFDLDIPVAGVTTYSNSISTPDDAIGHRIGSEHTIPSQVVDYFREVGAQSERVRIREHGRTHEGRTLVHAIVTSPENHANLEVIRTANLKLSDSPDSVPDSYYADGKLIVYMGYSVHGNEASGTEAAILTLYHLAAGESVDIDQMLNDMVIIIDPMLNPDGRDRFTDWVNRNRGVVHTTDGQDREHNEPWPGGRTNHYWFDLNRDWLPAVHPESQGRLEVFHAWRPQVHTDVHEMGGNSTYFFQPGIPSRTHHLTPQENQDLTAEIATYHAKGLESIGSLYFSEEAYDDFYYGKASAYPDANGAVGILFEQASSRALESETDRGNLHYAATVRNQFMTSLSTLTASVNMREKLLRYQAKYYSTSAEFAREIGVDSYVIDIENARSRASHLAELLARHRIQVNVLDRDLTVDGHHYRSQHALIVDARQPQARLLRSVMETPTSFSDSLFYDVSTWNLPYAFNLTFDEHRGKFADYAGDIVTTDWFTTGRVVGKSSYAYVMPWLGYYAARASKEMTTAGFDLRIMKAPITIMAAGKEVQLARGSVLIPLRSAEMDQGKIDNFLAEVAERNNVTVYGVDSGLTPAGPDLGSGTSARIPEITVALITGDSTASNSAGEVWHLLSTKVGLPVSLIDADELASVDLNRYNVLIYAGGTTESTVDPEPIEEWVRSGGTLITLASGTDWAVAQGLVELEKHTLDVDSLVVDYAYADLSTARGSKRLAGATILTQLDITHPLAYGLGETLPVFRSRTTLFDPSTTPGTSVGIYAAQPIMSGYVPRELQAQLAGKMAISANRLDAGKLIMFADNPAFRGFWYGSNMALLNAIFLHRAI